MQRATMLGREVKSTKTNTKTKTKIERQRQSKAVLANWEKETSAEKVENAYVL